MAQKLNSAIPHMHLYMAGMPLELVSQWLGHSQLETSLIYARATTDMKRKAVDKTPQKKTLYLRATKSLNMLTMKM